MIEKIIIIAIMRFRILAGTPLQICLVFLLPCFFMAAVNVPFAQNAEKIATIAVVDSDMTWLSGQFVKNLGNRSGLKVVQVDLSEARQMIGQRQAVNAFHILPGFQESLLREEIPSIEKWSTRMPMNELPFIAVTSQVIRMMSVVRGTVAVMHTDYASATENVDSTAWQQVYQELLGKAEGTLPKVEYLNMTGSIVSVRTVSGFSDGPFGMLLTFIALLVGYAITMLMREAQTLAPARITLATGRRIRLSGDVLGIVAVLTLQAIIALITWAFFLDGNFAISVFGMFAILFLYSTLITSLIFFLALSVLRSSASMQNLYAPIVVVFSLMGGCFISSELLPDNFKIISWLSPQGIAMNAYRGLADGGYVVPVAAALTAVFLTMAFLELSLRRLTFIEEKGMRR
jgi:ABC-type multidrug transport system permease subunit